MKRNGQSHEGYGNEAHSRKPPRRRSRSFVRGLMVTSILSVAVLFAGFGYACYVAMGGAVHGRSIPESTTTSTQPSVGTTATKKTTVHLVALGDSLAHGFGDASGLGFVGDLSKQYRTAGIQVIQSNLGIDGLTSSGLVAQLRQASVLTSVESANVILLSIGGNDLRSAVGMSQISESKLPSVQAQFTANLQKILETIRRHNASAKVLLVGLYNPYEDIRSYQVETNSIVADWNLRESQVVGQVKNAVVVPTADLFAPNPAPFLYEDHFHPNEKGYQRMADRIWQDVPHDSIQ